MKGHFKRAGSFLLALVMVFSIIAGAIPTAMADSWPNDTASAEPTFAGYRVKDIENWNPETDPYSEFLVASVPLQNRNEAFAATQANPVLTTDAQVMNMTGDYGNSFFGSTMYTNEFSEDVMTFWQYTDYFSPWHGAATAYTPDSLYDPVTSDWRSRGFEFGIVNIPNPAYTNAAHKNGVLSIACIYFDPAFRPGQTCADMLTEKDGDIYVVAKKLVEMAEYYGFDGYFLNQEEGNYEEFKPFMAYLTAQGLYTQWYDTNSSFNSSKAAWLKDETYGQIHNSVFVNYSSFYNIDSQLSYAESIGVDPYEEIFYGVENNQAGFGGGHYSATNLTNLYDENGVPRASYALFCASDMYHRGLEGIDSSGDGENVPTAQKDGYQWMSEERERMFWSGVYEDPTDTGSKAGYSRTDVGVSDADSWVGVADFIAERSVISGTTFYTNFNTGHGMQYFVDGAVSKDEEWTNINIQEMMPTWQWWFDSTDATKLHADFDYGAALINKTVSGGVKEMEYTQVGAWNGGSSLAVYGNLSGTDTMHLYKTDLDVNANSKASVTFRKVSEDTASMSLGLIFEDAPETTVTVALSGTETAGGWTTVTADLSAYAGRQIAAICLVFEGTAENYQMNIGNLTISDGSYKPAAPTGLTIDTAFVDGQMIVRWDMADYSQVVQYNLYGKMTDGSRVYLGGIYGDILYVKDTFCDGLLELQLCAVGIDGTESAPATLTYNYNSKVSNITVLETSSSSGLLTHAANAGKIEVSFQAPATGTPDGYELEVTLLNIASDDPDNKVYSTSVPATATSAVIEVDAPEGREYDLKIYAVTNGVRGEAVAYRGRTHDSYSEPIAEEDIVISGSTVRLVDPDSVDWYKMTATFEGTQVASFKRGSSSGNKMTFTLPSLTGLLSVVVEDYSGNFSEPTVLQLENGVPVDPTDLIDETHFPDPALLSAVRSQVGVTLSTLKEFTGVLDLSGTAVKDLTGLHRLPAMTGIDFTDCTSLEEISGLNGCKALKEITITGCTKLKKLDVSGLGLEKLVGEGKFNNLTYVNISNNKLDLSEGTPERAFLDTAIDVIENGVVVEPDPDPTDPVDPEPTDPVDPEPDKVVAELGENLVPGATVVTSSNINNVASFVDGDRGTDTYANNRNAEASVTLDLGETKDIGGFSVWTKMNGDDPARPFGIQSAKLEISDSPDSGFVEVGTVDVEPTTTAEELVCGLLQLDTAATGRYVRVTVTEWWDHPSGGNDWPAMYEAEVYEAVIEEASGTDSDGVTLGDNLVPGAEVVSSSNINDVTYFVDGDTGSSTYANNRNGQASVILNLGDVKSIGGFAVWTQMNGDDPARPFGIKSAKLEISDSADGEYTEVGTVTIQEGTTASELISGLLKLDTAVSGQYARVTVTEWWPHPNGGNDWPAMYEVQIFEALAEETPDPEPAPEPEPEPEPGKPVTALGENLAPGATVVTSSNINNVASFVDGNRGTDTFANDRYAEASVTLDLGETKDIGGFSVWTKMNGDDPARPFGIQSAKLEISDSPDSGFVEVGTVDVEPTTTASELVCGLLQLDTAATGRYVRVTVTEWWDHPSGGNDWPAMYEAEVYEAVTAESAAAVPAVMTLSVSAAPAAAEEETSLALTILGVKHEGGTGEASSMLIDGDYSTKWCSLQTPNYVVFDTGVEVNPTRLKITHAGGAAEPEDERFNTNDFALQILDPSVLTESAFLAMSDSERTSAMNNDANWMDLLTYVANAENVTDDEIVTSHYARIYRLNVTDADDNWWNGPDTVRIYEVELFGNSDPVVKFGNQRPVPYAAIYSMTDPIVREVAAQTLDMTQYAEISATIRGNAYETLDQQLVNGEKFIADDLDLSAKPEETFTISISDQNRQSIEGSVIDLSFDATWSVRYKNAAGETAATLLVIVGDGGEVTTPDVITNDPFILYATSVSGQAASEMPIYAFDGNRYTKWCPGGNAVQAELSIDVGAWYTLTEVTIVHAGHAEAGRNTVDFALQILKDTDPTAEQLADESYLTDDANWVTIASYTGNTANETLITFDEPVVGRYFRLDVTKGDNSSMWPSTRIYEWSMMGIPTDAPEGPETTDPVSKDALSELIEELESLNEDDYTSESWAALENALEEAKAVLDDPDATQEEVDAAVEALKAAVAALEKKQAHTHAYGEWTVTKEATCTEDGEETRSCACGATETRVIQAPGHEYESTVTAPTETERGYTTHTCKVCGHSYVDSYVDPIPGETTPTEPEKPTDPEKPTEPEKPSGSADTGDETPLLFLAMMLCLSAFGIALCVGAVRRKRS